MSRRTKASKIALTWPSAFDAYGTHLRARRAAQGTLEEQLRDLRHLSLYLERRDLTPDRVTVHDLRDYQVGLFSGATSHSRRPLAARTVGKITSTVRKFFAFLAAENLLLQDPTARLEQPRCPKKQVGDVLSVKEVTRLLNVIDTTTPLGVRDRAMVEVLYASAVRRTELRSLDLCDVDHDERDLVVRCGKGGRGRRVPLTRSAYQALRGYLDLARPLLVRKHADSAVALFLSGRGRRLDEMSLCRTLHAHAAKAAITTKQLTPHCLRRTAATHMLQGGASLRAIQLILGHRDLATTSVYLRLDTRELRRELLLKHPRERIDA